MDGRISHSPPLYWFAGSFACPIFVPYDSDTLTWYRAGLIVEQASGDRTGCGIWQDDGVFLHRPSGADPFYADIHTAVTASG